MRTSRTYTLMAIPAAAYNLIRRQLVEAEYHQAIHPAAAGDSETERLDMHGIALVATDVSGGPLRLSWSRTNPSSKADQCWEARAGSMRLVVFDRSTHAEWSVGVGLAAGDTLTRAETLAEGQIQAEEAGRQVLEEMAMAYGSTPTDELLRTRFLHWRGIQHPEDACRTCGGAGQRMYGSTATWRGGMGGAMMTTDVCDQCWGSGDRFRTGTDLRKMRDEEAIAHAAVDALVQSCGATFPSAAPQVLAIVKLLRDAVEEAARGRSRKAKTERDSIWFAPLAEGLANMLERAVRGGR